jgi:glycosyltransferase involved in cell wall biosynthesis
MKICHLTTVHPWNDVRIFEKECVSAAAAGFEVYLVAMNAPEGIHQGVQIVSISSEKSKRFSRMWKSVSSVYERAIALNADVYHFHDPELLRISGKLLKAGKKVIYDSHEDLPRQILDKTWIKPILRSTLSRVIEWYENKKAARLTAIVAATPHIQERFLKVNSNVVNVNNFPVLEVIPYQPDWSKRNQTLCYVGGITITRGIRELVESLPLHGYSLELAGNFIPENLRESIQKMNGWKLVLESGFVNRTGIAEILGRTQIGMVTLHPTKAYIDSLPIKLFEYMAAGLPVITSDFPLWRGIVEKYKCGICVDPQNPEAIAKAVKYLMEHPNEAQIMGENGRKASLEFYNWSREALKLIDLYKSL